MLREPGGLQFGLLGLDPLGGFLRLVGVAALDAEAHGGANEGELHLGNARGLLQQALQYVFLHPGRTVGDERGSLPAPAGS